MKIVDKSSVKRIVADYALMVLGAIILAAGYALFINPYNIVPGGVYGIGIALHSLFPSIKVGTFGFILNVPLLIIGARILGFKFGVKSGIISLVASGLMNLFENFIIRTTYFKDKGDPLGLQSDLLLAVIVGAILVGLGLGLIYKARGSSGGSDIIALILSKYTRWSKGRCQIIVDSTIVVVGFIVFQDWKIPLYSWINIYICGQVIDMTLKGMNYDNAILIVSNKYKEIADVILVQLGRGATYIKGEGAYTGEEKKIVFTVISQRELPILEYQILKIDPEAFVTNIDAREILGDGFSSLTEKVKEN